mmetsp:Transcript_12279/g.34062  ORF Transcript_12279/g.34062 Transcript_12279/m.34062 type:complete len:84 (-) Transcript_12279:1591-1842(-)
MPTYKSRFFLLHFLWSIVSLFVDVDDKARKGDLPTNQDHQIQRKVWQNDCVEIYPLLGTSCLGTNPQCIELMVEKGITNASEH